MTTSPGVIVCAGPEHAGVGTQRGTTFHNTTRSSTVRDRLPEPVSRLWDTAHVPDEPRFLTLTDVAEVLNVSSAQVYALVRSGDLPSIKVGGRGQYRVERERLEDYIQRLYAETAEFVKAHPLTREDQPAED
jgi:excisionase family DNA binding protein